MPALHPQVLVPDCDTVTEGDLVSPHALNVSYEYAVTDGLFQESLYVLPDCVTVTVFVLDLLPEPETVTVAVVDLPVVDLPIAVPVITPVDELTLNPVTAVIE